MPEELRSCPLCGKPGIGPFPIGETAVLPGALFYAATTCDHLHVEGVTEEGVIAEFNRRPREERLEAALREIADLEDSLCQRCEGNGRLYADGRAHYPSEGAETRSCPICGGAGRIYDTEAAQMIALAAIDAALAEGGERADGSA